MKTIYTRPACYILLYLLLLTGSALNAQSVWCPAFEGGATNAGTLVKMNADGSGFTKVFDFNEDHGSGPMGSIMQASNGKIYGTCINGGADSSCVIYCYDPATGVYTDVWDFNITQGDFPMSGLIQGPNGILYGAASSGGAYSSGVIYSFDPATNTYTDLHEMQGDSTAGPCGSPLLASDGMLYGITNGSGFYSGPNIGYGAIYRYDINNGSFTNMHSFDGQVDGYAYGSLIEHDGIFYGMTSGSPEYPAVLMQGIFNTLLDSVPVLPAVNHGNIFSFDPNTGTYTNMYAFDSVSGGAPYGTLLWANGKLYGMASAGGAHNMGVIFSYDLGTNTYAKLYDFDGTHGANPMGDLMLSSDGNLYGTTNAGGTHSRGVIFRFEPVSHAVTVINNFDYTNGSAPLGGALTVVNNTTGILTPKSNTALSVYPVPAHNSITVSIESAAGESPVLTLTDINGRTVWGPQTKPVDGNLQIQLDLSSIASGIYFLHATSGNNVITKKIVRQ